MFFELTVLAVTEHSVMTGCQGANSSGVGVGSNIPTTTLLCVSEAEGPNWDWVRGEANCIFFLLIHSFIHSFNKCYRLSARNCARLLPYIGKPDENPCVHGAHTCALAVASVWITLSLDTRMNA